MNSLSKKEVIQLIDSVIVKYKESDEYVRRCLLHLSDSISITSDECLKQGILSVTYTDNPTNIEVHITTDFIRNIKSRNTYDFQGLHSMFRIYDYVFIIDKLGEYWEEDKNEEGKVIIYNLLYVLSESDNIRLNCNLEDCIIYETIFEPIDEYNEDRVLNVGMRDFDNLSIKENISFFSNSHIYVNGYNRIMCSFFPILLECEKNNIIFHFENLVLYIEDEVTDIKESTILDNLKTYLQESVNSLCINYISIECDGIEKENYQYIKQLLKSLYNILTISNKPEVYVTMFFDYEDDDYKDMVKFYKKVRVIAQKYIDVFNFDVLDNYIKHLES